MMMDTLRKYQVERLKTDGTIATPSELRKIVESSQIRFRNGKSSGGNIPSPQLRKSGLKKHQEESQASIDQLHHNSLHQPRYLENS
jgi:hypothetical protein